MLFAQRAFMRFWVARLSGSAANQMMMVAVAWQMYDLTGSAWDLGLVGLLQFLPALMLTLVTGHVADRYNRGRILALCMVVQAALAAGFVLASAEHWVNREWLLALAVGLGTVKAFQMPTSQALVPLLVPQELLARALAFSSAGMQASIIAGPALGGFIYVAGAHAVYAVCGVLFAIAAALLLGLRYDHAPPPKEPVTLATIFAGVSYIWQRKVVLGAVSLDLFAVLLGGATALLPVYARDILHVGAQGLGVLRGSPAIGAVAMAIAVAHWPPRKHAGAAMLSGVAGFELAIILFGLSRNFWLSVAALAFSGAADMVSVIVRHTLIQLDTPDEMRGRVSAVNVVFIGASNEVGQFESGITAQWFGAVPSVVLGGLGTIAVVLAWTRVFPALRRFHQPKTG